MADPVRVAALDDLEPGTLMEVVVGDTTICLARTDDGAVYAFQNNCSHRDFPLHTGTLEDRQIECSWHGARFDIETGRALCLPAIRPIRTYDVVITDNEIRVSLD